MPVKKEIILNQEDNKANVPTEQNEDIPIQKPETSPKEEAPVPDKLIGDDLEIQKVKDHDEPEIDGSRDVLDK